MTFGCNGDVQWAECLDSLSIEWLIAARPEEEMRRGKPIGCTTPSLFHSTPRTYLFHVTNCWYPPNCLLRSFMPIGLFLCLHQCRFAGGIMCSTCPFVRPSYVAKPVNKTFWKQMNQFWVLTQSGTRGLWARTWNDQLWGQEVKSQCQRRVKLDLKAWWGHHPAGSTSFSSFVYFLSIFCLVPCDKLKWLLISFWVQVKYFAMYHST